ncbi:MAG: OmpH family outer membrane protein [Flavobacteriales bacterium]|nr:OmpH family outer membrane protein [Flavobacteriales bacterium]
MPKNSTIALVLWNVVLTALVAWGLLRTPNGPATAVIPDEDSTSLGTEVTMADRDTGALKEARIAYFHMDSLRAGYELIKEKNGRFTSEARRVETELQDKQEKAQRRYQELSQKDRTYSTQAEIEKDEAEVRKLMADLQGMQAEGEERMARLENDMLKEISKELEDFLSTYNTTAGYDYILSIQSGGQIWVGNKGLDITRDLVNGLNARHRAGKATKK